MNYDTAIYWLKVANRKGCNELKRRAMIALNKSRKGARYEK